jgi:membrane protease YdiL (CAAX protease family)
VKYLTPIAGGMLINLLVSTIYSALTEAPESAIELQKLSEDVFGVSLYFIVFSLVILSPLLEEWAFRSFLWRIFSRVFNQEQVMIITSILFAVCHMDYEIILALMPISFFLGWLRLTTGSIKYPMAAHIAHNTTGILLTLL